MKINGLVACWNFADYLAAGIDRWLEGLDSLLIATGPDDSDTLNLAARYASAGKIRCHVTDAWTRDGAHCNKGRAMEESRAFMPWRDWILLFDADIVPEWGWAAKARAVATEGRLHGAWRLDARGPEDIDQLHLQRMPDDRLGYGYFQLFHAADPIVQKTPLLATGWSHAGNYDSELLLAWRGPVLEAPIKLWHIGAGHNWFGRGRAADFTAMEAERRRRGGGWASIQHERISIPGRRKDTSNA